MKARTAVAAVTVVIATLGATAACGIGDKYSQPFQDAQRTGVKNSTPADVITMPDGFSNTSTKCDHGNRIYVAYHGDSTYAAIAVVAQDPTCK